MSDDRQEFEFIMEGITTRMQIAMDKLSEANKMLRSIVKYVCIVMLVVTIIVVSGFIIMNQMWFQHDSVGRGGVNTGEAVSAVEEVPQFRTGADDR